MRLQKIFLSTVILTNLMVLAACQTNAPARYVPAVNTAPISTGTNDNESLESVAAANNPVMRVPSRSYRAPKTLQGEAAIRAANKSARQQPSSAYYVNAIMTFMYQPGALYQVYSAPLTVTDLQFQSGEKIVSVAAGDTLRWQLSKTYSGSGSDKAEHIVLKPITSGLVNSLVVTTDRRTYHISLQSTQQTGMASVKWQYPGDSDLVQSLDSNVTASAASDLSIDVAHIDTNYTVRVTRGSTPAWMPTTVFNDGKKTYIQFAGQSGQLPTLFVGTEAAPQVVNYRVVGNYFVVDSVVQAAQLRQGQDQPIVVQISYGR